MLSGHFDEAIMSEHKKMKFIIDVIGKVRYIDYGERRYRESHTAPILGIEKKDQAEMLGNDIRPTGAKLYQQARYYVGANCDFTHSTRLGRGRCPYNPELRKIEKENKRNER